MRARRMVIAGFCAAALTLVACGDDDDDGAGVQRACSSEVPSSAEWTGEISVINGDFQPLVDEFNDFLADAEPPVSTSPCDAARVFLHIDQRQQEEGTEYQVAAEPGDSADAEVELTVSNVPDDSILAERWTLSFEAAEGDSIRLVEAERSQSCRPGRGHSKFTAEPCI